MKKNQETKQTILEAVDHLTQAAELDIEEIEAHKTQFTNEDTIVKSVRESIKTVHDYLQTLSKDRVIMNQTEQTQSSVRSIIALAKEATSKIDKCRMIFKKVSKPELLTEARELKELENFYHQKFSSHFAKELEKEAIWEESLKQKTDAADLSSRGMRHLEVILRDRDYELFQILKEDGSPFYNQNVARHIQLVAGFDHLIIAGKEDPFLAFLQEEEKVLTQRAETMYASSGKEIKNLWNAMKKESELQAPKEIGRWWMALVAACSHANKSGKSKSGFAYFADMHQFLSDLLQLTTIQGVAWNKPFDALLEKVCFSLLFEKVSQKKLLDKLDTILGKEALQSDQGKNKEGFPFDRINQCIDDHEVLYNYLRTFPSGPLFKILDVLQLERDELCFSPIQEQNLPIFSTKMAFSGHEILFGTMGSPTKQKYLTKAEIVPEFARAIDHIRELNGKFLMVQFQDRTSSEECARSFAVEEFSKKIEYKDHFALITLPKRTDFYQQTEELSKIAGSKEFIDLFIDQMEHAEESGFFISPLISRSDFHAFSKKLIPWIGSFFFEDRTVLSRKERLDFIEIFYQMVVFYLVLKIKPSHVVFCCKDGVDLSPPALASFLAMSAWFDSSKPWKDSFEDTLREILFLPAIRIRQRSIDSQPFNRAMSFLYCVAQKWFKTKGCAKELEKFFK